MVWLYLPIFKLDTVFSVLFALQAYQMHSLSRAPCLHTRTALFIGLPKSPSSHPSHSLPTSGFLSKSLSLGALPLSQSPHQLLPGSPYATAYVSVHLSVSINEEKSH